MAKVLLLVKTFTGHADGPMIMCAAEDLQDNEGLKLLPVPFLTYRGYQNWSFLKDYDPMGKKKEHEELPEYVSVFSDKIPNTSSRIIGSRMNTDLGKTLVTMDYFLNYGRRKNKLEQELQPA
ncbi:uncharacterized protein C2orf50 homolog isoform X5 [Hemicordylus capensis]|uniref:uncharacterized protein C2orf50 homolog isoform X5 n=1 Tax=Hemicordylus capensis TaxID=884348 RepID=UPI0023022150|nr:uncharacterized protein C2orf50 homolog isoform X5 [Hemicordylus capensis]